MPTATSASAIRPSPTAICCRARSARSTSPRTTSSSSRSTARRSATRGRPISSDSSTARSTRRGRRSARWSIRTPRTRCRSASPRQPLCCVAHVASDMGTHVPVWDIADKFGDDDQSAGGQHGRRAATWPAMLGDNTVVLMRGHGFSAAADSLLKVVRLCVYLPRNARILLHAMRLGEFKPMSEGEINSAPRLSVRGAGHAARLGILGQARRLRRHAWTRAGRRSASLDVRLIPQFA